MLSYHVGNCLIIAGFALLLYIYYPLVSVYLFPPAELSIPKIGYSIEIPKLRARSPIITNVNPFNETEYQEKLQNGVAHAKGTSLPGEKGTAFLFAHSSDVPWRISRYNTIFFRLGELTTGDEIVITKDGVKKIYTVTEVKEVWPNEIEYLEKNGTTQLILQTCTPIGTALKRLLVFASPK